MTGGAHAGEAAGPRVIYQIDAGSSARDVRRYSDFQDGDTPEDERLLPCGTAFEVRAAQACRTSYVCGCAYVYGCVYNQQSYVCVIKLKFNEPCGRMSRRIFRSWRSYP